MSPRKSVLPVAAGVAFLAGYLARTEIDRRRAERRRTGRRRVPVGYLVVPEPAESRWKA